MGLHFDIVDVFTDRAFAGNQLAVVHRARTLTPGQMQAIAKEFGMSETAFTMSPTTVRATYKVRIFTPARELPFAGHPSIGTAWALAFADMIRAGDVVQECAAGLLPVQVDAAGGRAAGGGPGPRRCRAGGDGRPRSGRPRPVPARRGRGGRRAVRVPAGAAG